MTTPRSQYQCQQGSGLGDLGQGETKRELEKKGLRKINIWKEIVVMNGRVEVTQCSQDDERVRKTGGERKVKKDLGRKRQA